MVFWKIQLVLPLTARLLHYYDLETQLEEAVSKRTRFRFLNAFTAVQIEVGAKLSLSAERLKELKVEQ